MRGIGNEQYDAQWEIQFHMTEYKKLERFLEEKAMEGYMIEGFTPFFQNGYFSYLTPGRYHFCVDIYPKKITAKLLASDEFNEYLDACRTSGWTPKTYYKNLVIFCSEAGQRPMELQTDRALAYELLRDTTLRTEERQLFVLFLLNIALFAFFIPSSVSIAKEGMDAGTPFYPHLLYVAALLGADALVFFSRLKRHMEIKKALREGLPLPKGRMQTLNCLTCILFPMAFSAAVILMLLTSRSFVLAGIGLLLLFVFLMLCFPLRARTMAWLGRLPLSRNDRVSAAVFALIYVAAFFVLIGLYRWLS